MHLEGQGEAPRTYLHLIQGVLGKGFTLGEERLDEGSCYLDKACRPVRDRRDLFIFWDCYNKGPQTEWYKSNRNCFSHCSGG